MASLYGGRRRHPVSVFIFIPASNLGRWVSLPYIITVDLYKALGIEQASYQASSIHSRRHSPYASTNELVRPESPPPLPPPSLTERKERSRKERRLLSELWLMSAATFRRSGKIEQARGAIQEAEVRDEENPNVWVQVSNAHSFFFFVLVRARSSTSYIHGPLLKKN